MFRNYKTSNRMSKETLFLVTRNKSPDDIEPENCFLARSLPIYSMDYGLLTCMPPIQTISIFGLNGIDDCPRAGILYRR